MIWLGSIFFLGVLAAAFVLRRVLKTKPWFLEYFRYKLFHPKLKTQSGEPTHVMFLFVDHFEPKEDTRDLARQQARMQAWFEQYPQMARRHRDADGCHPKHGWFYLVEEWETEQADRDFLRMLAAMSYEGFGEVDLHVHHGPGWHIFPEIDTAEKLRAQIERLKKLYRETGALITAEQQPRHVYGFIHGKWALDNSEQGGLYCGVNHELELLRRTGCYAEFTMPSGHGSTQSRKINSIYYAPTTKQANKNHDSGEEVRANGRAPHEQSLMIVQGMIEVYLNNLRNGTSVVEKSNLDHNDVPSSQRIAQWVHCNVHVAGRPNWVFVKVHTHGCREENFDVCFGEHAEMMHSYLEKHFNDGERFKLHYVSPREAYNIVKAAEAGKNGDPNQYRNFVLPPYANLLIKTDALYNLKCYDARRIDIEVLHAVNLMQAFEFKNHQLRRVTIQNVKRFVYEQTDARSVLRLWHQGRPQVVIETSEGAVSLETASGNVARVVRSGISQTEEALVLEREEACVELFDSTMKDYKLVSQPVIL